MLYFIKMNLPYKQNKMFSLICHKHGVFDFKRDLRMPEIFYVKCSLYYRRMG